MAIHKLAQDATQEILTLLDGDASKSGDVSRIIEASLLELLNQTQAGCVKAVNVCCSSDQDMAHKVADELRLHKKALIANLSSLR